MESIGSVGHRNDAQVSFVAGQVGRALPSVRIVKRLQYARVRPRGSLGKRPSYEAWPSKFEIGRLQHTKRILEHDRASHLLNVRMNRAATEFSFFIAVIGKQLERYLCLSERFWRLSTQATGKKLSNMIKDEGQENASTVEMPNATNPTLETGELPRAVKERRENLGSDIATVAMEATAAADKSTDQLLEAKYAGVERLEIGGSKPECNLERESFLQDEELLRKAALAENADEAMAVICQRINEPARVLGSKDCSQLIRAALEENNVNLAFSILDAMRSSQIQRRLGRNTGESAADDPVVGWRWAKPDVTIYVALVSGLAASLRVTDAIGALGDVKRRGIPPGDEVPFGKVVNCPTCGTALAVVQPHHGIQLVPCSRCRYQYELMSGDVVTCESESISMNLSAFERGLRVLQLKRQPIPAAVHSFVVRAPDGTARTHRFATASVDVPAQEGERVTVASAAPINASKNFGPFKVSTRAPGWRASEPMSVTNHVTGFMSSLLRAPPKSGSGAALDTSFIIPAAFILATSDAATALIDPTLPRTIAIGAAAATVVGTAMNALILPRLNQLPQRTADAVAMRQELLAQHGRLQARLQELAQSAAEEVRMLARMCQLQNKMEAVIETNYSARMERVRKARAGLDERLAARLELIDSYAKISSMIEIEVEMDSDVFAAEAGGAVSSIAEQIERLMEVEDLQKQWTLQAEVNDEVERLLQSSPVLPDSA